MPIPESDALFRLIVVRRGGYAYIIHLRGENGQPTEKQISAFDELSRVLGTMKQLDPSIEVRINSAHRVFPCWEEGGKDEVKGG